MEIPIEDVRPVERPPFKLNYWLLTVTVAVGVCAGTLAAHYIEIRLATALANELMKTTQASPRNMPPVPTTRKREAATVQRSIPRDLGDDANAHRTVLETCYFWQRQARREPTESNKTLRDTACARAGVPSIPPLR